MRRQSWYDRHGIRELVRVPKFPVEIVKILLDRGVPDATAYQQIRRGLDKHEIRTLDDGRIASLDYSQIQEDVEEAILRIINKGSLGFFGDASMPGYAITRVALDLGIEPGKIESEFYAVMRKLRRIAEEAGNDKKRFFEKLGWKEDWPGGPHRPPELSASQA